MKAENFPHLRMTNFEIGGEVECTRRAVKVRVRFTLLHKGGRIYSDSFG